jgi:hypothetical protein
LHVEWVELEDGVLADGFLGFEELFKTLGTAMDDVGEFLFVERGFLSLFFKHGLSILRYYENDVIFSFKILIQYCKFNQLKKI